MGSNKKYYWLKLKTDFFKDKAIKKLRRIAGGDTYTVIYLKLQLLSIENEGVLEFENLLEDTFVEELALEIDEDVENIKITLAYLERCGLVECLVDNKEYLLPQAAESIGTETQGAERVRKFRENKKMLQSNEQALQGNERALQSNTKALQGNTDVTNGNTDETNCNTDVQNGNTEREREIELELELRVKRERENARTQAENKLPSPRSIETFEEHTQGNKGFKDLGDFENIKMIEAEYNKLVAKMTEPTVRDYLGRLNDHIDMRGTEYSDKQYKSHAGTIRNWYNKDLREQKQYPGRPKVKKGSFNDYEQRQYDFDKLEAMLLERTKEEPTNLDFAAQLKDLRARKTAAQ